MNATKPSLELHKKILNLRYQYNQIISEKFSRTLMFMKQKKFEFGDMPYKLLSRLLRKLESDRTIHQIKSKFGAYLLSPTEINNLCRLINILYSSQTNRSDLMILSLDAKKSFDQVEWPYLFALLQKFQVGEKFITWLKILYKNPRARILTNKIVSPSFALFRG